MATHATHPCNLSKNTSPDIGEPVEVVGAVFCRDEAHASQAAQKPGMAALTGPNRGSPPMDQATRPAGA